MHWPTRFIGFPLIAFLSCFTLPSAATAEAFGAGTQIVDPVELAETLGRLRRLQREARAIPATKLSEQGRALAIFDPAALRMPDLSVEGGFSSADQHLPKIREATLAFGALESRDLLASAPPVGGSISPNSRGGDDSEREKGAGGKGKSIPLLGLPTEAGLVIGLADFLAERAKAEGVHMFLVDLRRSMTQDSNSVAALMPASIAVLGQVEATGYRALTPALASAFHRDLTDLPERLTNAPVELRIGKELPAGKRIALRVGLTLFQDVRKGSSPAVALQNLLGPSSHAIENVEVRTAVLLAGAMARDFCAQAKDEDNWFHHPDLMPDYVAGLATFVRQEVTDPAAVPVLTAAVKHAETVQSFLTTLETLQKSVNARAGSGEKAVVVVGDLLESVDALATLSTRLCGPSAAAAANDLRNELQFARELQGAISSREWGAVASKLLTLLPSDASRDARFLVFACNLASARDPDTVREALSAAAMPAGSFRAKRTEVDGCSSRWRLSINGYLGPEVALETRRGSDTKAKAAPSGFLSGLIGVEVSHSTRQNFPSSYSLFLSAFELGNVIAYRASHEDDLEDAPELGFRQITAPGVFVVLGISKSRPLSLGLGYQVAPHLRKDITTDKEVDVQRLSVFLSLDLPLLSF